LLSDPWEMYTGIMTINEILAGYARADEFLEKERRQRLANMTPEDSRAIFNELVEFGWRTMADDEGARRLQSWRLETKIAVRKTFEKLARSKGLL